MTDKHTLPSLLEWIDAELEYHELMMRGMEPGQDGFTEHNVAQFILTRLRNMVTDSPEITFPPPSVSWGSVEKVAIPLPTTPPRLAIVDLLAKTAEIWPHIDDSKEETGHVHP